MEVLSVLIGLSVGDMRPCVRSMLEEQDGSGLYRPVLRGEQGPEAWSPELAVRARRHLEEEIYEVIRVGCVSCGA